MKQLNKLIIIFFCTSLFISTISFGTSESLLSKTYTLIYGTQQETTSLLINGGELYVNVATLKSLLGFDTSISGTTIEITDVIQTTIDQLDSDGNIYSGKTLNGKRHGYGTLYIKDGGKYEGQWINDYYDGTGTLVLPNGNIYVGQFSKGFIHGEGKMFYPDGSYYTGHYKYGIQEGFGLLYIDKDNKYEGYWANGLRNGKGKAYINGYYRKGLWENNHMIKTLSESEFNF